MKRVVYNGGKTSLQSCSDPSVLVKGQVYDVIGEEIGNFHTNYILKGISGKFNSVWFDICNSKEVFLAVSHEIPKKGTCLNCNRLNLETYRLFTVKTGLN